MKRVPALLPPSTSTTSFTASKQHGKGQRDSKNAAINQQLQERLQGLSFPAFEHLVQQALSYSGFDRIHAPGRSYRRGRLTHGGLDISAYSSTDLTDSLTLVQIKQYRHGVPRRFVDELRGVMLRLGARHGLLIATSHFSPAAYAAAGANGATGENGTAGADSLAPIRLLEGHELSALLIQHGLAVRQQADGRKVLDKRFLRKLEANAAQPRQTRSTAVPRDLADPAFAPTSPNHNPVAPPAAKGPADQKGNAITWSTHVLFGISSLWLLQPLNQVPSLAPSLDPANFALLIGAAAFGALLPDLDAAESKLKHLKIGGLKPFFLPAQLVHRQLGHRGLAHSLSGLIFIALLALPLILWWGWAASLALVLGYASHLFADACTKSGIPFFYPHKYRYHLLPPGWRFTTGSQAEELLFPFLVSAALGLLLIHLYAFVAMPL